MKRSATYRSWSGKKTWYISQVNPTNWWVQLSNSCCEATYQLHIHVWEERYFILLLHSAFTRACDRPLAALEYLYQQNKEGARRRRVRRPLNILIYQYEIRMKSDIFTMSTWFHIFPSAVISSISSTVLSIRIPEWRKLFPLSIFNWIFLASSADFERANTVQYLWLSWFTYQPISKYLFINLGSVIQLRSSST